MFNKNTIPCDTFKQTYREQKVYSHYEYTGFSQTCWGFFVLVKRSLATRQKFRKKLLSILQSSKRALYLRSQMKNGPRDTVRSSRG